MSAPDAQLLLIHDGELDDVRSLLDGIEVTYREVTPAATELAHPLSRDADSSERWLLRLYP